MKERNKEGWGRRKKRNQEGGKKAGREGEREERREGDREIFLNILIYSNILKIDINEFGLIINNLLNFELFSNCFL